MIHDLREDHVFYDVLEGITTVSAGHVVENTVTRICIEPEPSGFCQTSGR